MSDPLDLSRFNFGPENTGSKGEAPNTEVQASSALVENDNSDLQPMPPMERLVDVSKMLPSDLEKANAEAALVNFFDSMTIMRHGQKAMEEIANASRNLLTNTRIGDTGDVGRIAASVIDGVKVLRLEDLKTEANQVKPDDQGKKLFKRLVGSVADFIAETNSAYRGFEENRKLFLKMMDEQKENAIKKCSELTVQVQLMDEQRNAVRKSLYNLMISIAAGQIALLRGETEYENLRVKAIASKDPADAAMVMTFKNVLNNFRAKIAEMREAMTGSALLLPIIEQNKNASEVRINQINNGVMVVIPHLMAVASQAVVSADISRAAAEGERLREANRMITEMGSQAAHDAAISAAISRGGDPRDIETLEKVARQAIETMREIQRIDNDVANHDRDREAKLVNVRNELAGVLIGSAGNPIHDKIPGDNNIEAPKP